MDEQRRQIIISEIQSWQKNHLLPEHYCIFLLNLYTEGDAPAHRASRTGDHFASGSSLRTVGQWLSGAVVIASAILFALHFNELNTGMQISILAGYICLFYLLAWFFRRRAAALTHICLLCSFLLLVVGGTLLLQRENVAHYGLLGFLAVVCLLWLINGLLFRFSYLLYCSMLGLGFVYGGFIIGLVSDDFSWWLLQLSWIPVAGLLIAAGYAVRRQQRQLCHALLISGVLMLFGPEISAVYIGQASNQMIQLWLFGKILVFSLLFFMTRAVWFQLFRN